MFWKKQVSMINEKGTVLILSGILLLCKKRLILYNEIKT